MARVDTRLRAWGWLTRRMMPIATMKEADVIAAQARPVPKNAVTNWLFGTVSPGVETADRRAPGATGDIPVRVYQPAADGAGGVVDDGGADAGRKMLRDDTRDGIGLPAG